MSNDRDAAQPSADQVEAIFRTLNREVWIVTAANGNRRGGLIATWFSPASLDRSKPVVVVAIAPLHFTRELIDGSGAFAAHLLAPRQIGLAWNFGLDSGRQRDKFDGLPHRPGGTGSPILEGALAWLECRVVRRLDGGERIYYWASVVAGGRSAESARPVTDADLFAAATPEQRERLRTNLAADVAALRPLAAQPWRLDEPS